MQTLDVTIPSGQTDSEEIDLPSEFDTGNYVLTIAAVIVPSNMTGTALNILSSPEATTYYDTYDSNGSLVQIANIDTKDGYRVLDPSTMAAIEFLKIQSNASEGADRTLTLVLRKFQ